MKWPGLGGEISLEPTAVDPNVWKVIHTTPDWEETTKGLILVYVDDLLIMASGPLIEECIKVVSQEWEVSKPEWLGSGQGVKFLGTEIWLTEDCRAGEAVKGLWGS